MRILRGCEYLTFLVRMLMVCEDFWFVSYNYSLDGCIYTLKPATSSRLTKTKTVREN